MKTTHKGIVAALRQTLQDYGIEPFYFDKWIDDYAEQGPTDPFKVPGLHNAVENLLREADSHSDKAPIKMQCDSCNSAIEFSEILCANCATPFLARLRELNERRCKESFSSAHGNWTNLEWAAAAAGEMGELLNKLKKARRGEEQSYATIAEEIADVVIYLDLLCSNIGIDSLEEIIRTKFNQTSERVGFDEEL